MFDPLKIRRKGQRLTNKSRLIIFFRAFLRNFGALLLDNRCTNTLWSWDANSFTYFLHTVFWSRVAIVIFVTTFVFLWCTNLLLACKESDLALCIFYVHTFCFIARFMDRLMIMGYWGVIRIINFRLIVAFFWHSLAAFVWCTFFP